MLRLRVRVHQSIPSHTDRLFTPLEETAHRNPRFSLAEPLGVAYLPSFPSRRYTFKFHSRLHSSHRILKTLLSWGKYLFGLAANFWHNI